MFQSVKGALCEIYDARNISSSQAIGDRIYFVVSNSSIELLDNIFYNIDVDKLNGAVATSLLYHTQPHAPKLAMRAWFVERCKERFNVNVNAYG